ncbi:MAG: cystathionine gamma-synthase [Holophagales bacterium]|nr:cystathionine gamma-synthase [Holophagales bacterium]
MTSNHDPATRAGRAARAPAAHPGAVGAPRPIAANFTFAGLDGKRPYDYTRSGNPTRTALAEALGEAEGGHGAVVTASGMAAVTLVCQLLDPRDRIVAAHDCYGGTFRLLDRYQQRGLLDVEFVDLTNRQAMAAALSTRPNLVLVETPSNPLLRITDLEAVCRHAKQAGALVVADNTFMSPALQRPIEWGADVVIHSTTKYLNGHSDVIGGAVIAATPELHQFFEEWANMMGVAGAPFDSYLTLRGLRTLHSRLRCHEENALAVVAMLREHPAVERVYHPSLPDHPGHDIASRQQDGFGAMASFDLRGDTGDVAHLVSHLACFAFAESLGGVESLISHPATMSHASMTAEARAEAGISDQLLRLSIGIEHADDLVADLRGALDRVLHRPRSATA